MGTLIILAAIGVIILWVFIALEFKGIAEMKGHDSMRYFWWTFILGPIGMLMVIALPQETKDSVIVYRDEHSGDKRDVISGDTRDDLPEI